MPEQVWLGQFNIISGQPNEAGPYAATLAGRNAAGIRVDLFLVLQPTRPDTDGLCGEIAGAIEGAFGHTEYSVTGNLLLACGAAQQRLREWNRSSLPEHRMGLGLTLMALAGDEAYLAQAGPSTAFYRHAGRLDRLEPQEQESQRPLGLDDSLAPWFHRLQLGVSDTILLLSGSAGERVEPRAIDHLLSLDPETALSEIYRYVRSEPNVGAVLVSVLDDLAPAERSGDDTTGGEPRRSSAQPPSRSTPERAPASDERPRPGSAPRPDEPRRRGPSPLGRNAFTFDLPPEMLDEPVLDDASARGMIRQLLAGLDPFRRVRAGHPDKGDGVLRVLGDEKPRPPLAPPPYALASAGAVLEGSDSVARSRVQMRAVAPGFRSPFPSLAGAGLSRSMLLGGIGVVALGAALWFGVPALANSGRTQRFTTLMRSTQTELAGAQSTQDLGKRRELLNQAMSNVDEARRLKPDDPAAASAATSVADAVTVMNAVYNVPSVPVLADLSAAGLSNSTDVEVATGDRYYVLDLAGGKVIGVPRDNASPPEVIYEAGSSSDGVQGAKASHIAWQSSTGPGDPGTLLILDEQHHLFGYSRLQLRSMPLRGAEGSKTATAMAFANASLYILDAPGGTVWKYAPSSDGGFNTDPAPAVARADIKDATGMSVVGGIFLTGQDGKIRRFVDGQENDFTMPGIDKPPAAPQAPIYDATSSSLFVADRGNSRVVQLQGDGRFERQLVNTQLGSLRGLAVDPGQKRLVGVTGQSLVAIPLP